MKINFCIRQLSVAFTIICCALTKQSSAQQFFTYSQYMNNLTPVNHNYSLLDRNGSISSIYRKQLVGIQGAPTTLLLSSSIPLEEMRAATGLVVMNDQLAVEQQTVINGYFAKGLQLSPEGYLAVSLNLGLRRYVANYSQLDPADPTFSTDYRESRPNIGFGVMYYSNKFYVGISVPEISIRSLGSASTEDNVFFRNHYYLSGAYITGNDDDDIRFKPAFLYTYTRGIPAIADVSTTMYIKNALGLGFNYRTNKEAAAIMTIKVSPLTLGYGYRFNTTTANVNGIGLATHELMLTFNFGRHMSDVKLL